MRSLELSLLIYFVYGLTYFVMGLVLLLEYWRLAPEAPQKHLVQPLAAFGLIHGLHEWLEILLIAFSAFGETFSPNVVWLRLGLLTISFIALAIYGYRSFRFSQEHHSPLTIFGAVTLPVFAIVAAVDVIGAFTAGSIPVYQMVESLVRYLIGVPGAAAATIGLRSGARKAWVEQRRPLDKYLNLTAIGFAIYSLTQLFVPAMNTHLARIINIDIFQVWTSIPIPVFRTIAGIIITVGLFFITSFLETDRQKIVAEAQKARLNALKQEETIQRLLLRQTIAAQEEERTRIARELHDEMAQTLTAFSLDLATLQQDLSSRPKYQNILARLQNLGKTMFQGIQRMISDLRPAHLDDLGLVPALKFLTDQVRSQFNLSITFETQGHVCRLEPLLETAIYRIVQESLTNIARHASTDQASVNLSFSPDEIQLQVTDQGSGFDPEELFNAPRGWGLAGMKERAEAVNGKFSVKSKPAEGTTIIVVIPTTSTEEHTPWAQSG